MKFEKGAIVTAPNGKQYARDVEGWWFEEGYGKSYLQDMHIAILNRDHDWKLSYPEKPKSVFNGKLMRTERTIRDDIAVLGCHTGLPPGTDVLVIPKNNIQYDEVCTIYRECPILVLPKGNHRVIVVKEEGGQG